MGNEAEQVHSSTPKKTPGGTGSRLSTLVERVKLVLLKPDAAWDQIARESTAVPDLFRNYVIPLAVIPPVCQLIRMWTFGLQIPILGTIRWSFLEGITNTVVSFVLSLVAIYIFAAAVRFVAEKQQVSVTRERSFQLLAYSATPGFVAGFFQLIPGLWIVGGLLSLYGLYLLYLGIPKLTSVTPEKQKPFFGLTLLACVAVSFVLGIVFSFVVPRASQTSTINYENVHLQRAVEELQRAMPPGN